jgi:hypothetical protein
MKESKDLRIWMFLLLGVIVLFVIIWNVLNYPSRLEEFHKMKLQGELTYIYSGSGGTRICLNNESEKHLVFTEYNDNIGSFFYRFVSIGDSIYKAPNDMYVHVFKQNKEFLFKTIIK